MTRFKIIQPTSFEDEFIIRDIEDELCIGPFFPASQLRDFKEILDILNELNGDNNV